MLPYVKFASSCELPLTVDSLVSFYDRLFYGAFFYRIAIRLKQSDRSGKIERQQIASEFHRVMSEEELSRESPGDETVSTGEPSLLEP